MLLNDESDIPVEGLTVGVGSGDCDVDAIAVELILALLEGLLRDTRGKVDTLGDEWRSAQTAADVANSSGNGTTAESGEGSVSCSNGSTLHTQNSSKTRHEGSRGVLNLGEDSDDGSGSNSGEVHLDD